MPVLLFFLMKNNVRKYYYHSRFSVKSPLGNHEFTVAQRRFKPYLPEMSKKIGKVPERTFPIKSNF